MVWKETMKEWGSGDISFLSEDGEVIEFMVVGDPHLIEGKFRGNETKRVGIPAMTLEGFTLLVIGMRVARRLAKYEGEFKKRVFSLLRRGEQGDTKTRYELTLLEDPSLDKLYLAAVQRGVDKTEIADAVKAAKEAANG